MNDRTQKSLYARVLAYSCVVALCVPLVMGQYLGYELGLPFLLAPLVALSVVLNRTVEDKLFIMLAIAGLVSCVYWQAASEDPDLVRSMLSLTLILYSIGFVFLGRYASRLMPWQDLLRALSILSSIFGIAIATRLVWIDEAVRIEPDGLARLNAVFFGVPIFGTFGVLSLAHLWCIQALLVSASIVSRQSSMKLRLFSVVGLGMLLFLILSSNARSATLVIPFIALVGVVYLYRSKALKQCLLFFMAAFLLCFASFKFHPPMYDLRIKQMVTATPEIVSARKKDRATSVTQADTMSSGRIGLVRAAWSDIVSSPILGNGFRGYGAFGNYPMDYGTTNNSSTHVYYVTLLWKGGVLFLIPYLLLLALLARRLWRRRHALLRDERFFIVAACVVTFGFLALTWDILIVPSAGALAYFLLGLLAFAADEKAAT